MPFYRLVPAPRTPGGQLDLIFRDDLVACDLDNAPDFKWKDPSCIIPCRRLPPPLQSMLLLFFFVLLCVNVSWANRGWGWRSNI